MNSVMSKELKYKRVLLVNPPYPGSMERGTLRAGLGYIAEVLTNVGAINKVIDLGLNYTLHDLEKEMSIFSPDLIGLPMMTYRYRYNYQLIERIKKLSGVPVVVGGPHVSTFRKAVFDECSGVDFGIVYEGEETIVELCKGYNPEEIKGLFYRNNGSVCFTGERRLLENLDAIPFPRYSGFDLDKYISRAIPIVTSRGCPYSCIYCTVKTSMGRLVRTRSASSVVDELQYWYNRGRKRFGIVDDNFTFYDKRVFEICDEIERRSLSGLELLCNNGVRADRVSKEMLRRMKAVGFSSIAFGVEGGNNKILKTLKKGEKIEAIKDAVGWACGLGYEVELHFVVGAPHETWNDIQDSLEIAAKYPIVDFHFNNLIPYPQTELFNWVQKNNYFMIPPKKYLNTVTPSKNIPVFETPDLSSRQRIKAIKAAERLRRKVRRRHYISKLRKYGLLGRLAALVLPIDFILGAIRETRWAYLFKKVTRQ